MPLSAHLCLQQTRRILLSLLIVILCTSILQAKEKITIGLIPEINVFEQMERYQALADYLGQELNIDSMYFPYFILARDLILNLVRNKCNKTISINNLK